MTKASDAYAEAQRLIAAAASSGATELSFNTAKTHALTRIPEEIKTLTALTKLHLWHTKVTDLTPISALTVLTTLALSHTKIPTLPPGPKPCSTICKTGCRRAKRRSPTPCCPPS